MALYTPRVAIDAIPPNNYPPKFVAARLLPRLGATVLGLATVLAAKASIFDPLPSRPPNHCVTPFQLTPLESSLALGSRLGRFHASVVVELLVMATFGYLYVSGVALQRPAWFGRSVLLIFTGLAGKCCCSDRTTLSPLLPARAVDMAAAVSLSS